MSISIPWRGPWSNGPTDSRGKGAEPSDPHIRRDGGAPSVGAQARFGGNDREGEWATVYVAATIEEGHIVRGALIAEGIPAILGGHALADLLGGAAIAGVPVRVPQALEDRARLVLEGK